jgi:apolipoprotein N-acyltransferase
MNVPPLEKLTFYARNGDWLSRLALPAGLIMLLFTLYLAIKNRNRNTMQNSTV